MVRQYKYFRVVMDDKLSRSGHSNAVDKKIQYRRAFLRKLGSFKVCNEILFCESVFGGVLVFTCVLLAIESEDR